MKPIYIIDRLDSLIELYQGRVEAFEKELAKEDQSAGARNTYRALYNKAQGALIELRRLRTEILIGTTILHK